MTRIYSRQAIKPIETYERERPQIMRHSVHVSRDAETAREDVRVERDPLKWINPTNLDAPEPRPGMVQRWVTDGSLGGNGVTKEWTRKMREGWMPRDPQTVPPSQRLMYPSAKSVGGMDVIRVAGLVLCEMPRTVAMQRKLAVDDVIERQRKMVPDSLNEARSRMNREAQEKVMAPRITDDVERAYTGERKAATLID